MSKRWDVIEQAAILKGDEWRYKPPSKDDCLRSIAISLKRIADTLDGTAVGVDISDTIFGGRQPR